MKLACELETPAEVVEVDVVAEAVSQADSSSVDHGEMPADPKGEIGAVCCEGGWGIRIWEGDFVGGRGDVVNGGSSSGVRTRDWLTSSGKR